MDELKRIVGKNALRLGVDEELAFINILLFSKFVGIIENNDKTVGSNPTSSAKGLYQYINGSVEPAINRLRRYIDEPWMDEAIKHKDANRLSRYQQTLMFVADMLERRGSDKYMKAIMEGSATAAVQAYLTLHHTNPDIATIERVARKRKEIYAYN